MADVPAPVVLLIYNRPATTARVMASIAEARPPSLVVVADGPVDERDEVRTKAARAITERIDWPCRVERSYAAAHLGLRTRFESGMRHVLDRHDAAILLEDDCVPHPTFFDYCQSLLVRYRDDERVMTIGGSRLTPAGPEGEASYAFSRYPLIWGWATWRRAWRHYDGAMRDWPEARDTRWLETVVDSPAAVQYWAHLFERTWREGPAGNWDYAWVFNCWRHGGLGIVPAVNLVSNIGFGADSSHTTDPRSRFNAIPAAAMRLPLAHPAAVERDAAADAAIECDVFGGNLARALGAVRQRVLSRRGGPVAAESGR